MHTITGRTAGIVAVLSVLLAGTIFGAEIQVAPNPWIPEDDKPYTGDLAGGVLFRNLPPEGDIFIYSIAGSLVRHLEFSDGTGTVRWSGTNDGGQYVASGLYLWVVRSGEFVKTGKLLVIR